LKPATDQLPSYGCAVPADLDTVIDRCAFGYWRWSVLRGGVVIAAHGGLNTEEFARQMAARAVERLTAERRAERGG
jgi:hypothetical protein